MTSLTAPASPRARRTASPDRFRHGLAELHVVAAPELRGVHEGLAVEQRAVARTEVFHVHRAVAPEQTRVHGRHERVVGEHDRAPATPTDGDLFGEVVGLAVARRRLEDL